MITKERITFEESNTRGIADHCVFAYVNDKETIINQNASHKDVAGIIYTMFNKLPKHIQMILVTYFLENLEL